MRLLYFLIGVMCSLSALGQTFVNMNNALGLNVFVTENLYGSGVSFVDIDQNGLDDLTFCTHNAIKIYLNMDGNSVSTNYGFVVDEDAKHPTWVDYDNDGDLDFFHTQYGHPLKLYQNDGTMNFTDVSASSGLPANHTNDFGVSWGDYDRDGDLDLFVCTYIYLYNEPDNYDWNNHLYRNDGDGTFTDVSSFANVQDGISVSFQSVWIDYNNDRWPDLYVINDKEHPNRLYHNNADGTFTEIAQDNGSSIDMVDAMTASCGDFNNDGFEDIFVTNTSIGDCALLRNEGDGTFTDIAISAGVDLDILGWAGNWFDYDLDADLDLYVCEYYPLFSSQPNAFMINNGDETFVNASLSVFPFDFSNSYSSAMGDWNDDGYPDLAVSNYSIQNANMWRNTGGNGKYIKFDLEGVVSNRNGIGSRIQLFHDTIYQSRQTYCGENYLGQNSFVQIVGLGETTVVDSLIVEWPSGFVDQFFSLSANEKFHLVEGSTYAPWISSTDTLVVCPGDSILITAGNGNDIQWNTGEIQESKWISAPGEYYVQATHDLGFFGESQHLIVVTDDLEVGEIEVVHANCFGESSGALYASLSDSLHFTWVDLLDSLSMSDLNAGMYSFMFTGLLGCEVSGTVEVGEPPALIVENNAQPTSCFGTVDGTIVFEISGGTSPYDIDWDGLDSQALAAGNYSVQVVDSLNCQVTASFEITEPDELIVELSNVNCTGGMANFFVSSTGGTGDIVFTWNTGALGESLEGVAGDAVYWVAAVDENGCEVLLEDIECPLGLDELHDSSPIIFPNPASSRVFVENWKGDINDVYLVDPAGRMIMVEYNHNSNSVEITIPEECSGAYQLVVRNDVTIFQEVVIIE
jgi:hypothetical protein